MNKTNDFKYNLPAYSDPVDIEDLNDNFRGIDDALMAGLCKKDYTGNNMGSSDPSARKYAWAPWLEIVNDNEFDVVVTDRNAPVGSEEATINIAAGQTFRKYINGRYYMNFYVQDQHDVTFKWFVNAETYINESGGGGGGTGTVTSVSVQGGSGSHLTGSGNPIETSGTITINVDEGYSIPSDNEQTAWDGKAADLKFEINSSTFVITVQLKDSSGNLIGNERTIDLPLETMVVDGEYDPQTQKIKLELKNGNYVEFSVADLVSGLQTELSANNKLDPDYIEYDSTHRAVTDTEKDTWNGKQNALTFDDTPTQNSNNPVKSGGIYTALAGKQASLDSTQLAAVNSGIDSAKVGQISTNQTNILSVEDMVCATEFSSSTAYAVGDMVTYEHKLYKFINAHQGAWSASDVQNYDLTYLQAEDRAALAEVVDSGAKNLLDFASATFTDVKATSTKTSTSITITADSNGDWSRSYTSVNLEAGSYVFTTTISNYSKTVGAPVIYIASSATGGNPYGTATITGNGTVICSFNIPTTGTYYLCYYVNDTATASGVSCSYTASNNMICTKAAFGVSKAFVPYRPNYDLVCGNALGYTITQTSTSFSNVLANAMEPYYFKNDYDTHTGMLFISTDVTNEYYVAYFSIDRGQSITIVKLSNNVIDLSAYNDAGSIVLSGGTAPYTLTVKYNN